VPNPELSLETTWADQDLIGVRVVLASPLWAGGAEAFVTRTELTAFADALDALGAGAEDAVLEAGQRDLGYADLRVYEYGLARRLAVAVHLGTAAASSSSCAHGDTELRTAAPVERGAFAAFAAALRAIVRDERGRAALALLPDWP
jgi:hypothetical protein